MQFLLEDNQEAERETSLSIEVSQSITLELWIAEDDFNDSKKTLFATYLWSGSLVLAKKLVELKHQLQQAAVLEFGAAAGLPSITAAKLGAELVCASDYPSPSVLSTLHKNILSNQVPVSVVPHIWGEDVETLLQVNAGNRFDVILAAECLWKHDSHSILLNSIIGTIKPGGLLMITYSHHIPDLEAADDHFLTLASEQGFHLLESTRHPGQHMWSDREVDIFFCVLRYSPALS